MFSNSIWNSSAFCTDFFTVSFPHLHFSISNHFVIYCLVISSCWRCSDSTTHTLLDLVDGTAVVHLPLNSLHQVGRLQYMVDKNRFGLEKSTWVPAACWHSWPFPSPKKTSGALRVPCYVLLDNQAVHSFVSVCTYHWSKTDQCFYCQLKLNLLKKLKY